jgi:hypothetical protein
MLRGVAKLIAGIDQSHVSLNPSDTDDSQVAQSILPDPRLDCDKKWGLLASWLENPKYSYRIEYPDNFPTQILELSQEDKVVLQEHSGEPYVARSHR